MRSLRSVVAVFAVVSCVGIASVPLAACSTEPQADPDPNACQELKACCAGLPEGQKKKDCNQVLPSSTGGNVCRANVQTYCGDAGAGKGDASSSSEGGSTTSDAGGSSEDCATLKKQCESCANANGKSSCEALVNQDDAASCKAALDQQVFASDGATCQQ